MLRLILETTDAGAAAHVGGPVEVHHYTYDVNCPVLEAALREKRYYGSARVIGASVESGIAYDSKLVAAARAALNYIENTESELGMKLASGDLLRAALGEQP